MAQREILQALAQDKICSQCPGLDKCPFPAQGYRLEFHEQGSDMYDHPTFGYAKCTQLNRQIITENIKQNIDKRFQGRTFAEYERDRNPAAFDKCMEYSVRFDSDTKNGLMLSGPVGVGKTHLAGAIIHEAISKGIDCAMVVVPDLLEEIRFTINNPEADKRLAQKVAQKHLLVLDDLGAEKVTDWVRSEMYKLINKRYENELPTIITTNFTFEELAKSYGQRAVDKLAEMCEPVVVTGQSYRRRKR